MQRRSSHHFKHFGRMLACRFALVSSRGLAFLPCATPMSSVSYMGATPKESLIVFLPGLGDFAEDFEARGFINALVDSGLPADAIAVDAHYGYYARRSVIDRLAHDVVLPAHKRGYRDVWLVGISMGGMGALSYAAHHAEHVRRVLLLGPYLGEAKVIRAIREARSSSASPTDAGTTAEHVRKLWHWIGRYDPAQALLPKLYLGYGTRDRFALAGRRLSEASPR